MAFPFLQYANAETLTTVSKRLRIGVLQKEKAFLPLRAKTKVYEARTSIQENHRCL
jgi:hypothetical protein